MRIVTALAFGAAIWLITCSSASADVQLTIQDGRVSLVAKEATLSEILMEWSKVGHTVIVNAERVPGGPMTLQLTSVPEEQAIETLLRSLSGYIAEPRRPAVASFSRFDRILVMPTIAPPVGATAGAQTPVTQPVQPPNPTLAGEPMPQSANPTLDEEDERMPVSRNPRANRAPQSGGPVTRPGAVAPVQEGQSPLNPAIAPQPSGAPSPVAAYPRAPTTPTDGVAVPGMIVAPPQQPGQPNGIQQPKRPGGH